MSSIEDENLEEVENQEEANLEEDLAPDELGEDATPEDDGEVGEVDEEGDATPEEDIDYTYKFNGEVYEFDERIKAMASTPEQAELLRELVEKADYVSQSKDQRQELRYQNEQLRNTEVQRQQAVQQMQNMVQSGNLNQFHKTWGISEDQVLQEAMQIMRVREMSPEDRAIYDRNQQAAEQNMALQMQNQQYQQHLVSMQVNQREGEIQQVLAQPEIGQAAHDFDQAVGRPGAFREEMIKRGQYYAQFQGRDVPPQHLAQEMLSFVPQRQGGQAGPQEGGRPRVVTEKKPTMPRVKGSSGSPVKSGVRSIADIRKLAQEAGM